MNQQTPRLVSCYRKSKKFTHAAKAELQIIVAEQKLRTERILGQLLKDAEQSKNGKEKWGGGGGTLREPPPKTRKTLKGKTCSAKCRNSTKSGQRGRPKTKINEKLIQFFDEQVKRCGKRNIRCLTSAYNQEFKKALKAWTIRRLRDMVEKIVQRDRGVF